MSLQYNLKYSFSLAVLLLGAMWSYAQPPSLRWVKELSAVGIASGHHLCIDSLDNVYTLGYFSDTIDLQPGPLVNKLAPLGNDDGFVSKMDSNGNLIWFKQFGGLGSSISPGDMSLDENGNLLIVGTFSNVVDFDPGPGVLMRTTIGWEDAFVLKLSPLGNLLWVKTMGGSNADVLAGDVVVYPNGNLLVTGRYEGNFDADPGTGNFVLNNPTGWSDAFLIWLDTGGNFVSAKKLGSSNNNESINGLEIDALGNTYIQGAFRTTMDFDPGAGVYNMSSNGGVDIFVLKLSPLHTFLWAKRVGGINDDFVTAMRLSPSGNLFLHGTFSTRVDFDPGLGVFNLPPIGQAPNSLDGFVTKWDAGGNFVWAKLLDGGYAGSMTGGSAGGGAMVVDDQDRVLLPESATNSVDLDPNPTVIYDLFALFLPGSLYSFVMQLDANGDFEWARLVHGILPIVGGTNLSSIELGVGRHIYLAGTFNGTVDFDLGYAIDTLNAGPSFAVFVAKFWGCTTSGSSFSVSSCDSFVWRGNAYTVGGTYYDAVSNLVGCDSILTLNLTITHASVATIIATTCSNYVLNAQTYTTSGTYTQTLPNSTGCDSTITLNLTVNTPSSSTITNTGCDSLNFNGQTFLNGGIYTQTIPNVNGCDSTITLNLSIPQSSASTVIENSCEPTFAFNGITYSASGTYIQQQVNSSGCDSTITLVLTLSALNPMISQSGPSLISATSGAIYQWLDCNNGYAPIPGTTSQSFVPAVTGNYAVDVTLSQCRDTSNCLQIVVVGVTEPNAYASWMLMPNPTSGLSEVRLGRTADFVCVRVMDVSGKLLSKTLYRDIASPIINLENLAQGVYLLEVFADDQRRVLKVIKE